jgi:hypothetical protein
MMLLLVGALLAALGFQTAAAASTDTAAPVGGNQYVLFPGTNGRIYEAFYDSDGWHHGLDMCVLGLGCSSISSPLSVAVNPSNDDQYVIFVGSDGDIYEAVNQSGAWHGATNMCTSYHWGCDVGTAPDIAVS